MTNTTHPTVRERGVYRHLSALDTEQWMWHTVGLHMLFLQATQHLVRKTDITRISKQRLIDCKQKRVCFNPTSTANDLGKLW
jgi:hypothetical protein